MVSLLKTSVGDLKAEWLLMKREIEALKVSPARDEIAGTSCFLLVLLYFVLWGFFWCILGFVWSVLGALNFVWFGLGFLFCFFVHFVFYLLVCVCFVTPSCCLPLMVYI